MAIHDLTQAAEHTDDAQRRTEQAYPDGIDHQWRAAMDAITAGEAA